jgi:hypothetical protein
VRGGATAVGSFWRYAMELLEIGKLVMEEFPVTAQAEHDGYGWAEKYAKVCKGVQRCAKVCKFVQIYAK